MVDRNWEKRVDELKDKELINENQNETLKKMLASPDQENVYLAKEILGNKIATKLVEGLNEGQTKAFASILDFLGNPVEEAFVLRGYAGTGKTFLVKRILEYIASRFPNRKIAITAPTNKAVRVLQESAIFKSDSSDELIFDDIFDSGSRMSYQTIHKLLGLKEQITASGQQLFTADGKNKNDITSFKYLIVDEVSMLSDDLCEEILKHTEGVRIIFMGDPAQIPPIGRLDTIPFKENTDHIFRHGELTEIMRQKGDHAVVDASFLIRNNLEESQPIPKLETKLNASEQGIVYYNSETDRSMVRPMLKEYFDCDEFRANANYAKVIAWRNKTVNYLNSIIREILYGKDAKPYVVGEKLIANKPIFHKVNGKWGEKWTILLNTSEEMQVETINIKQVNFNEGSFQLKTKVYSCLVNTIDPEDGSLFKNHINIIHEDSHSEYVQMVAAAKKKAINMKSKSEWVVYFNILKWSANVAYNYAITAHKAQGSTYNNVLLMEEDLDVNTKVIERNRIKYTAYSRPTDKLFILRKNY